MKNCQEIPSEELDSDDLGPILASLKYFKASYKHNASASAFCYDALRPLAFMGKFFNIFRVFLLSASLLVVRVLCFFVLLAASMLVSSSFLLFVSC